MSKVGYLTGLDTGYDTAPARRRLWFSDCEVVCRSAAHRAAALSAYFAQADFTVGPRVTPLTGAADARLSPSPSIANPVGLPMRPLGTRERRSVPTRPSTSTRFADVSEKQRACPSTPQRAALILALLLCAGCSRPPLPSVALPDAPTHVIAVTIRADIDDRAIFCVEVTPAMAVLDLIRDAEICDTIGSLRYRYAQIRSAN